MDPLLQQRLEHALHEALPRHPSTPRTGTTGEEFFEVDGLGRMWTDPTGAGAVLKAESAHVAPPTGGVIGWNYDPNEVEAVRRAVISAAEYLRRAAPAEQRDR